MEIVQAILPAGNPNRPGGNYAKTSVTIHETGNTKAGAWAVNNASYGIRRTDKVSVHYYIDDHSIYQTIPDNERANHSGKLDGNNHSLSIEICVNSDGNFAKAVENAVWLTAELCRKYGLTVNDIKQHYDWNKKDCPYNLRRSGWEDFKAAVAKQLGGTEMFYTRTIKSSDILRIEPIMGLNNKVESISSIKARTGATYVLSGGTFTKTLSGYKVDSMLVLDGKTYSDAYCQFGYAMRNNQIAWSYKNNVKWPHFAGGFNLLVKNGTKELINSDNNKRGRMALGLKTNGDFVYYCCGEGTSSACTIPELADIMINKGCHNAIGLDGSYSAHTLAPDGCVIYPAAVKRDVLWYICIWTKEVFAAVDNIKVVATAKTSVYDSFGNILPKNYIANSDVCTLYTSLSDTLSHKIEYPVYKGTKVAYVKSLENFKKL